MDYPVTQENLQQAAENFKQAIEIDAGMTFDDARNQADENKGYPKAWGHLGYCTLATWIEGWSAAKGKTQDMDEANEFTLNGINHPRGTLDYDTHWDRAFYLQMHGPENEDDFGAAIAEYQKAMDLNVSDLNLRLEASEAYVSDGQHEKAIEMILSAGRQVCHDWYHWDLAWAYFFKARTGGNTFYRLAIEELRKMYWSPGDAKYMADVELLEAACYARLGEMDRADVAFARFQGTTNGKPDWTVSDEKRARPFKLPLDQMHLLEACKLAGLQDPEGLVP